MYDLVKENGELLVDGWEGFNHSYGKVLYRYPGAPTPELVERMFRKSYREFYLRPSYMARQLIKRRSREEYRVLFRGFEEMVKNIIFRR